MFVYTPCHGAVYQNHRKGSCVRLTPDCHMYGCFHKFSSYFVYSGIIIEGSSASCTFCCWSSSGKCSGLKVPGVSRSAAMPTRAKTPRARKTLCEARYNPSFTYAVTAALRCRVGLLVWLVISMD